VESVIPALAYGPACNSTVQVRNLGERVVTVEAEAHRESGALVPVAGFAGMTIQLQPHATESLKAAITVETYAAWIKIRENVQEPGQSPVVAVSGSAECITSNQLRTAPREAAYPTRNPWFEGDVSEIRGDVISLINTSEHPAKAALCYSSGGLYSVPHPGPGPAGLQPICSNAFEVLVPPFGSRQFPVVRDASTHFSMKTQGEAIVLQMLRPIDENVKIYAVDSTIKFGEVQQ
jgi:hypothetical protein